MAGMRIRVSASEAIVHAEPGEEFSLSHNIEDPPADACGVVKDDSPWHVADETEHLI